MNPEVARAANEGELRDPPVQVLSPPAGYGRVFWRYTTGKPGPRWALRGFNMNNWSRGRSAFGSLSPQPDGETARTPWDTPEIWLRRVFRLPPRAEGTPELSVRHSADAQIYLNGALAAVVSGTSDGYVTVPIAQPALDGLSTGFNVIAVHAQQNGENPFIDVSLAIPMK
jgi:hypothetical protein